MVDADPGIRVRAGRSPRWLRTVLGAAVGGLGVAGVVVSFLDSLESPGDMYMATTSSPLASPIPEGLILLGVLLAGWPRRSRHRFGQRPWPAPPWLGAALAVSLIVLGVVVIILSFRYDPGGGRANGPLGAWPIALWPLGAIGGPVLLSVGVIIAAWPQQHGADQQAAAGGDEEQGARASMRPEYWIGVLAVAGSIAGVILGQVLTSLTLLTPVIGTVAGAAVGAAVYATKQESSAHTVGGERQVGGPGSARTDHE